VAGAPTTDRILPLADGRNLATGGTNATGGIDRHRYVPAMTRPYRVAVLCFSPVPVFEMAVPCEVWGVDRRAQGVPAAQVRVCTAEASPLRSNAGFTIDTPHGLEALRWADLVCVPGWPHHRMGDPVPGEVVTALRRAHRRGARIVSFCSGAFVLAGAGLLDGVTCTMHWMHVERFRRCHPALEVDASALYSGDGQVFTSAGTAAAVDLCLHLVRLDHGAEVANVIARRMVVPPHRDGGQAQFVEAPVPAAPSGDDLSATLEWACARLHDELSVEVLARRAAMAPRTFARRFKEVTGTTPLQWLLAQRVLLAQRLLETTALPVEQIAQRCGFGAAATLRLHFGRIVGTSPQAYRRTFGRLAG
jgi:transcriptional regulator GlxA family with amidase domain